MKYINTCVTNNRNNKTVPDESDVFPPPIITLYTRSNEHALNSLSTISERSLSKSLQHESLITLDRQPPVIRPTRPVASESTRDANPRRRGGRGNFLDARRRNVHLRRNSRHPPTRRMPPSVSRAEGSGISDRILDLQGPHFGSLLVVRHAHSAATTLRVFIDGMNVSRVFINGMNIP